MRIGRFRLGMRTLKSALAVFLCIILFRVTDRGQPMIAALAAVFSLRQDFSSSVTFGKSRVIGNTLGGALAILYFVIQDFFPQDFLVEAVILPILVIVAIVVSDGIDNNSGIISAISTLLMISLSIPKGESVYYAFDRVIDTFIGTFIGIALNFFMRPKEKEKEEEINEDLIQLEKKERELTALREKVRKEIAAQKQDESKNSK